MTTTAAFGVDTILPSQFFGRAYADRAQPERRLAAAVLESAVDDYRRYGVAATRRARRRFAEVEEWFGSDDATWPFSFHGVCNALGLNAEWLRGRLRRERAAALPPPTAAAPARSMRAEVAARRGQVTGAAAAQRGGRVRVWNQTR
jgi:hypothetical protein